MSSTLFNQVNYTLGSLMNAIELGTIGLPDLQRPFVWKNTKVRNLFDSMYRGFPVGYLLLWQNANAEGAYGIGSDEKQKVPNQLIVDGQQRLTSLYAVIKGVKVFRADYKEELIQIAFNPLMERFEVADAAIKRDRSFIPNISVLWRPDADLFGLVDTYLESLSSVQTLEAEETLRVKKSVTRLQNMMAFPFTALTLAPDIDEEQVSEIFVRINSAGKSLNQADFILTLMSVFWDKGRSELENFCRRARIPSTSISSPYNQFIDPSPDQLLRTSICIGFRRSRLKSVYSILRGKALDTSAFGTDSRKMQFKILKEAQENVLDLHNWRDFLKSVHRAGFRSRQMISSENNLVFSYSLFLLGRIDYGVDGDMLERLIAQWFFMTALTGRYTGSPETVMEMDLARFRDMKDAEGFTSVLRSTCSAVLTRDYWSITLPNDLATSSARSPSLLAFIAALSLLDARALFSRTKVSDLLSPTIPSSGHSLERYHLFPRKYLMSKGISVTRQVNQIANYTVLEGKSHTKVSDQSPVIFVPKLRERFSHREIERMYYWHALPEEWEKMNYTDFLRVRRERMAKVIGDAYTILSGKEESWELPTRSGDIDSLIEGGENTMTEFKATLRTNLHTGLKDSKMEFMVLKTIAAFVNSSGGTLIIGVKDDGDPIGIGVDNFKDEDKMNLHLVNLMKDKIDGEISIYAHPNFDDYRDHRVLKVECLKGRSPMFVKEGNTEKFFVRHGAATIGLSTSEIPNYLKERFGS